MSTSKPSSIDISNSKVVDYLIGIYQLNPDGAKEIFELLSEEQKSKLLKNYQVKRVLAQGIDLKKYRISEKEKKENTEKIKSMTPAKRAVELHNNSKYDDLYSHQQQFQDELIGNYADNLVAIAAIESVLPMIDMIKLDIMSLKDEENNLPVAERSVVHGGDIKQSTNETAGVDGVSYGRNQSYDGLPEAGNNIIDIIITQLEAVGISESDVIRLIVLRLGLGKYGGQTSDGRFYNIVSCGEFAYSRTKDGNIYYLSFSDLFVGKFLRGKKYMTNVLRAKTVI